MKFIFGLDPGKRADPAAMVLLEQSREPGNKHKYQCSFIRTWPLGTPYLDLARDVERIVGD